MISHFGTFKPPPSSTTRHDPAKWENANSRITYRKQNYPCSFCCSLQPHWELAKGATREQRRIPQTMFKSINQNQHNLMRNSRTSQMPFMKQKHLYQGHINCRTPAYHLKGCSQEKGAKFLIAVQDQVSWTELSCTFPVINYGWLNQHQEWYTDTCRVRWFGNYLHQWVWIFRGVMTFELMGWLSFVKWAGKVLLALWNFIASTCNVEVGRSCYRQLSWSVIQQGGNIFSSPYLYHDNSIWLPWIQALIFVANCAISRTNICFVLNILGLLCAAMYRCTSHTSCGWRLGGFRYQTTIVKRDPSCTSLNDNFTSNSNFKVTLFMARISR